MTQNESDKLLVLVDGSSYLYRAYHAMPALTNSKGEPTGAVYGVVNMLRRLLKDYGPRYVAVVFDAKGKTFRDDLYADYKANRPPMPDDLGRQLPPLLDIIEAMGLPLLQVPDVEADDVIGTLARQAAAQGTRVVISTGDKDMAQLVDENVTLTNTMTQIDLDAPGVEEKFGVPPERIIEMMALVGDPVDNIPGIAKVGPKTAAKWLHQYGSLEQVMEHADDIKGQAGDNLRSGLDQLPLWKDLVTIRCDVELDSAPEDLALREPDDERLRSLYQALEFKTWLAEVLGRSDADAEPAAGEAQAPLEQRYETVFDEVHLQRWIERLREAPLFAFDTETTDLDCMRAELVGVSFCVEPGEAAYVPLCHQDEDCPTQLDRDEVLERLRPLLEDPDRPVVGQHIKYDMNVLGHYGIELRGCRFDTMLESYVLDSTANRHDMDTLALKHLGHKTIHYQDVAGKGAKQVRFDQVPVAKAAPYAAEDADVTLRLHRHLWPKLEAQPTLRKVFEDIEIPLIPVLSAMERNGVLVDREMLALQSGELENRLAELRQEAFEAAGQEFNLDSPKQIQQILFEQQGLPVLKKTPKGQPSTAEDVLQELALDYPLPRLILEHRGLSKLKSTYTDRLPACINERTGRVHTSYHQAVAATGRLSSSEPNLQNIPVRTEEGRRIRRAFVAGPGNVLLAADYSQIELRIMAHLSGDPGLVNAFASGEDVHRATAAEVFEVDLADVSPEQRRSAKAINFGLIYGMSAFGLARQLNLSRAAAQEYVERYFARYPGVREFMDNTRALAHEQGYVETVFGRRLYLPEINARNNARRQYAERTAINAPMQGTAADIIKRAMLEVHEWITHHDLGVRMIMQVHDELVFEVPETALDQARAAVIEKMTKAAALHVPLVVDSGIGGNWDEAH